VFGYSERVDINELLNVDTASCDSVAATDFVTTVARVQAQLEAVRLRAVDRVATLDENDEWSADLLACELQVTLSRAGNDIDLAHALTHRLPNTLAALAAGELDRWRAEQIQRATTVLTDELALKVDALLFPKALELNPDQLARFVRRLVLQIDPNGAEERRRRRREERRIHLSHEEDGVSWLQTLHASEDAVAMFQHIDTLARDLNTADEPRTIDQLRADVHRDLVLGTLKKRVTTHVYVTCTAETLLGLKNLPGDVRGVGPLSAERIRELAFDLNAEWSGVLVDDDGHAMRLAEKRYRPSRRLREFIGLRDRVCSQPACNRVADMCDLDHRIPFSQSGVTTAEGSDPKCRRHHRAKQSPYWRVETNTEGDSIWVSTRTRRKYVKKREPIAPPPIPTNDPPPF
jgi:hypothetical protein